MFIFPLVFIASFIAALRELYRGKGEGILLFIIFGLSLYTTAMSVTFILGFKTIIPAMQLFKEALVISVLILNIVSLKVRPRFHVIDYALFAYLGYLTIYAFLPIGDQTLINRLLALKVSAFYIVVYFTARLFNPKDVFINKYFTYVVLLTIAAGGVLVVEIAMSQHLQTLTGYADYNYYFFNAAPDGNYGLSTTFESASGYRRYASFFTNPLEHAEATLLALAIIFGLYTSDDNKFKVTNTGMLALGASFLSIIFAFSRAPLASYFVIIYIYALLTKHKAITNVIHVIFGIAGVYLAYLFFQFETSQNSIVEVIMNTIDFSDPSSVGHIQQWVEGVLAIIEHPMGLGLGASGRISGSVGDNVGGENQFIVVGVQAGIISIFLYVYSYVLILKTGLKWLPVLKGKERKVCMAVVLIKVGLIISVFTSEVEGSSYISYINWFLCGLLISMIMQYQTTQPLPAHDN